MGGWLDGRGRGVRDGLREGRVGRGSGAEGPGRGVGAGCRSASSTWPRVLTRTCGARSTTMLSGIATTSRSNMGCEANHARMQPEPGR